MKYSTAICAWEDRSTGDKIGGGLQKGGRAMNKTALIDWKFVAALGAATVGIIFAVKMDAVAVERVSIHAVDAYKEYAIAGNGNC